MSKLQRFLNKKVVSENILTIMVSLIGLLFVFFTLLFSTSSENRSLKLEVIKLINYEIENVEKQFAIARCSKDRYPEKIEVSFGIYESQLSNLNGFLRDLALKETSSDDLLSKLSIYSIDNSHYEMVKLDLRKMLTEQEIKSLDLYCKL